MNQFNTIIFDWDGTLMDSAGRIVSAMKTSAANVGLPVPEDEAIRHIIGLSMDEVFNQLFPGANELSRSDLFEEYRFQYIDGDKTPTPLFQGVDSLLQNLREHGFNLAVATGKARKGLLRVMGETKLERYFDDSICADEAESKPSPQMLNIITERNGWHKQQCLMIGDTSHDLQMAASAGIASIGVSYGAHPLNKLSPLKPLHILDDINQLADVLSLRVAT